MWHFNPSDKYRSQKSTTPQQLCDRKYTALIEELRKENQYKNKALKTAENLISTYKKENEDLKGDNLRLENLIKSKDEEINLIKQMMEQISLGRKSEKREREQEKERVQELSQQIEGLMENKNNLSEKIANIEQKLLSLQENFNKKEDHTEKICKDKIAAFDQIHFKGHLSDTHQQFHPKEHKLIKHKNLTQLRALHMKLKDRQASSANDSKNNKLCELATEIIKQERERFCTPNRSTKLANFHNQQTKESGKKVSALSSLKRERSSKKSAKKIFK